MVYSYDIKNKTEQNSRQKTYSLNVTEKITKKAVTIFLRLRRYFEYNTRRIFF